MRKQLILLVAVTLAFLRIGSVRSLGAPPAPNLGEELFKLTASDAERFRVFGRSVGISGNLAVIGSSGGFELGSAYLFDVTTGEELLKLSTFSDVAGDEFGNSVAISGNRAIVGAYAAGNSGTGSAYLFDVTTGQELFKLTASDAVAGNRFGGSVAISGNMAVVGAYADSSYAGSAYVFDMTTGQELFKLTPSDSAPGEFFGYSVAISDNVAIVGSLADVVDGGVVNSAYLFDVTTGQQLRKLTGSNPVETAFGDSVGISGNIAIVGSPDAGGTHDGSAHLFDVATGQELFELTASDGGDYDLFGVSVAISGNTAIVGAEYDAADGIRFGSAYLFDVTTGKQLVRLTPSEAAENAAFGASVAIDGDRAIIGAPETRGFTGAAYIVYAVPETTSLALFAVGVIALAIRRSRRFTKLTCLICCTSLTAAAPAAQYTVTDLGTLGGTDSLGWGINASGQVTGYATTTDDETVDAFLWNPTTPNSASGMMHDLGSLGGSFSWGIGINAQGHVAGISATTDDAAEHATLWIPTTPNGSSGTLHDLQTLGGTYSQGTGINDSGQVTGYSDKSCLS